MDIFKSNIKKGVGEGNFGYGKYKKDGSGLDFTQQTKKKLQKEKDDFMKGKNKFGPEPTNYSNVMANLLEKATAKLDQINDKMAYKLDMVRPSKVKEMEEDNDSFGLHGFKDKGEYKEKKVKDVIYSIKKYNNPDRNEELLHLYQARKKYLMIANKTIKTNTKFSSFDKLAKMVFDEYIDIYYYSTIQKKYCKVVIDPNTNKIVSIKIINNKTVNFSLSNDTHLNSQLNNLFSLLEQVERTDDVSKPNVLKLKVSLDNFFNTHSTDTQVEEIQNELRDEYNTFVEENFEHKIDNDIIFIYSKFKIIINKIQNSLENKRTNFSLINKNFNNMRNSNMANNEFVDLLQRMKEIRMSHNFSNDIAKQHELYELVNQVLNFSEGKMSGTEYKIKQLVSKLPADKKSKGTEKLNSMVSNLKKKGLKEKEIISRLDAKAGNIDRLVAFSKKSSKEDLKKAAIIAGSSLLGAGAAAGGAYAANKATGGKLVDWGEARWEDVKGAAGDAKDWTLMQLANGKTAVVDAAGKIQGYAQGVLDNTMSKFSKNGVAVSDLEQVVSGPTPVAVDPQVEAYFSKKSSKLKKAASIAGAVAGTAGAGYGAYAAMPHIKEGIDTYKTGSAFKGTFAGQTPDQVSQDLEYNKNMIDAYHDKATQLQGQLDAYNNNIFIKGGKAIRAGAASVGDYLSNMFKSTTGDTDWRNTDPELVVGRKLSAGTGADAAPVSPENAANDGQSGVVEYFYSDKWDNWF